MTERKEVDIEELVRNLEDVKIELVEREHRWTHIIRNFVTRKQWTEGDERRKAAMMAALWRVFAPATLAFSIGGSGLVVALWNVWEIKNQNNTLGRQTGELVNQNKSLEKQIKQFADQNELLRVSNELIAKQFKAENYRRMLQRKTELIGVLWDTREIELQSAVNSERYIRELVPTASATHRRESSIEYVQLLAELGGVEDTFGKVSFLNGARLDGIKYTDDWAAITKRSLRSANLSGASLYFAKLSDARLGHANLSGAHLNGADLTNASLAGANLEGAVLNGAVLENAVLTGASLKSAMLMHTDLRRAFLSDADFSGAHLEGLHLAQCDISGALNVNPKALMSAHCWDEDTRWPDRYRPPTLRQNPTCTGQKRLSVSSE